MNRWKLLDKFKKHFKHTDEEIFHVFKRPELDVDISKKRKDLRLSRVDIDNLNKEIQHHDLDIASNEIYDTESDLVEIEEYVEKLEEWGDDWKSIALELFTHMLVKHPNEIDDISICENSINENLLNSIKGINKFNL